MKDYSSFFNNPESYMLKYNCDLENQEIQVTYASKKTNTYPLTKETLNIFERRLENQYEKAIENHDEINNKYLKRMFILALTSIAIFGLTFLTLGKLVQLPSLILSMMGSISLISALAVGVKAINTYRKKNIYKEYLQNKNELTHAAMMENNITKNISKKEQISNEQLLVDANLTNMTFNVHLMDKLPIKDLKELLVQLKIYQGLQEPVEFNKELDDFEEEVKPKKRKREKRG